MMAVMAALILQGKNPIYSHYWGGTGTAAGRNLMFSPLKRYGKGRGFIIDYDIKFPASHLQKLVDAMKKADERHLNIVSPYFIPLKDVTDPWTPVKQGIVSYLHRDGTPFTKKEMLDLKDWKRIEVAGLGFYYGDIDPNYKFREMSGESGGEDINFFLDNKIPVYHVDLAISHLKTVEYRLNLDLEPEGEPISQETTATATNRQPSETNDGK
jgi:hypothetical protein